ncbi:MAG TPA: L-threonylcarbamoyladenylate synthase [Candidatus Binataceae bacterium]|nr:L-threonylcarbamoyladenylate synthase [Candidatus Binataceae bacterium]
MRDSRGSDHSLPEELRDAVKALLAGELIVFPTETFYAIGADPMQREALDAIIELKGRDPNKPIALIAAEAEPAFALARTVPPNARLLAQAFWPGPLTMVLPAREGLNYVLIGPTGGIGVRVSPHPIARALATGVGGLLTATSANLSGQPPARTLAEARHALGTRIRFYVDGGALNSELPSTVGEFQTDGSFRVVRRGAIDQAAITAALRKQE